MGLYTYLKNGYSNLPDLFDVNLQDYIPVWRDGNPFRAKIDDITVGFQNRVVVKNLSDFGTVSNNRVRPDSSKLYMLDGFIDMENVSIEVPEGGLSIAGLNGGRDVMGLISDADNHTFFVSPVGGYSGDVVMESMTVNGTGANSKCFDLDNAGNSNAIDITGVNFGLFGSTMSCGDLTEYRQLLLNNVGLIFVVDGFTFHESWTGIAALTSIVIGFPASATLFQSGTNFTLSGSFRSDFNFLSANASSTFCNFSTSEILSDGGFSLTNVRTSVDDPLPNLSTTSEKVRIKDCSGIRNTYVGGQWTISTSTTTTISAANTPVKMAGTTTYADLQWFTQTTDNAFVYASGQTIEVECKGVVSISGGNNDQVSVFFRQWDDSASSYVDAPKSQATLNGGLLGTRAEGIPFFGYFQIDENDRIEVWVENNTNASDVTALLNGLVSVNERPS